MFTYKKIREVTFKTIVVGALIIPHFSYAAVDIRAVKEDLIGSIIELIQFKISDFEIEEFDATSESYEFAKEVVAKSKEASKCSRASTFVDGGKDIDTFVLSGPMEMYQIERLAEGTYYIDDYGKCTLGIGAVTNVEKIGFNGIKEVSYPIQLAKIYSDINLSLRIIADISN